MIDFKWIVRATSEENGAIWLSYGRDEARLRWQFEWGKV